MGLGQLEAGKVFLGKVAAEAVDGVPFSLQPGKWYWVRKQPRKWDRSYNSWQRGAGATSGSR